MFTKKSKPIRYFDVRSRRESDIITKSLALQFAANSGRFSADLLRLVINDDHKGLSEYSIEYFFNDHAFHIRNARQCLALFQKNIDIDIGVDREAVAFETFAKAEFQCKQTNAWIRSLESSDKYFAGYEPEVFEVRRKIALILGPCPSIADLQLGFGPGSNTTVKKTTSHRFKLEATPVCSKEAVGSLSELWQTIPHYASIHQEKCRRGYGQLSFVPKNAKTDRSIIVEPIVNTFVQKGIGSWIKCRLRMFGCNLKDQTKNQRLARLGSLFDNIATIDLSSASDTLALALVVYLLPTDWVDLLSNWRTGCIEYRKRRIIIEQEKFSSMGNGFTFELESLIFYSVAMAVAECQKVSTELISVFGDDIIVPSECYERTCGVLELFGFSINKEKSYAFGSFRESCGADFFQGQNVRPFYVKDRWTSARIVGILNFYYGDEQMLPLVVRKMLLSHLPYDHRLYGPVGYGDGHIHSPRPELRKKGTGHVFETHVKRPKVFKNGVLKKGDSLVPIYEAYLGETDLQVGDPLLDSNSEAAAHYVGYGDLRRKVVNPRFEWWKLKQLYPNVGKSLKGLSSREFDPYTVGGAFKEKKVRVFIHYALPVESGHVVILRDKL